MFVETEFLIFLGILGGFVLGYFVTTLGGLISSLCDYNHYRNERLRKEAYRIRYEEEKSKE